MVAQLIRFDSLFSAFRKDKALSLRFFAGMSSQNPTKRGNFRARTSRNLQLERELNRSRSSSLPRTKKKRTIGDMEDDEIRPSTSSGRQGRGRQSQKGSPSKIKRTSRSFSGSASRRGASSSTSTQAVTSKRSKSRIDEDKQRGSNKHILRDRKFRLEEGVDLRQQVRQLDEKVIDLKEKVKLKDKLIRKLEGAKLQSDQRIKKSVDEKETLARERSSLEKELSKMRKRAEKAELELTKIQSINSATSSNNGGGEGFFQDILGNLQDFLDNQLQCTICSEVYLIATVTSW